MLLELDDEFGGSACCFFDRHFRWDFTISWEKLCGCRYLVSPCIGNEEFIVAIVVWGWANVPCIGSMRAPQRSVVGGLMNDGSAAWWCVGLRALCRLTWRNQCMMRRAYSMNLGLVGGAYPTTVMGSRGQWCTTLH